MYYQSALLAALAGITAATYNPHQLNGVRSLQERGGGVEGGLPRRQDDSSNSALECQASVFAILSDLPTPTPPLVSYLASFAATANPTDPAALCAVTSALPTSLTSAYSSYDRAASSWYSGHSAEVAQLASDCAGAGAGGAQALTEAITALETYTAGGCTGTLPTEAAGLTSLIPLVNATATNGTGAGAGAGAGTTATPTGPSASGTGSQGGNTSSIAQGAAARPTGVVAGAMAAAGLLGAVAML